MMLMDILKAAQAVVRSREPQATPLSFYAKPLVAVAGKRLFQT